MFHRSCSVFAAALLAASPSALAQFPARDSWIVAGADFAGVGGGLFLLSADLQTFTQLTGTSQDMTYANCAAWDPRTNVLYVGTLSNTPGGGHIYRVDIAGTTVVAETQLTNPSPDGGSISGIAIQDDNIWFVTSGSGGNRGAIGYVPIAGGSPQIVYAIPSSQISGSGNAISTNGREIFIGTTVATATPDPFNIWKIDRLDPNPTLVGVALIPRVAFSNSVGQMGMGRGGWIFSTDFGGFFHRVDPVTGNYVTMNAAVRSPQSSANGGDYNPWRNLVGVIPGGGGTPRELHIWDESAQSFVPGPAGSFTPGFGTGVASNHVQPIAHFGEGCDNSQGREPRCGIEELAQLGQQNFALTLRNGEPNGVALLMIGISNQQVFGVPLPIDLSPAGALGCSLLVSFEVVLGVSTDAAGAARFPGAIPADPTLNGGRVYVQWIVPSPVNTAGFISSDGAKVEIRS